MGDIRLRSRRSYGDSASVNYQLRCLYMARNSKDMIRPIEIEKPVIKDETSIGREFREMMRDLGIHIYKSNGF